MNRSGPSRSPDGRSQRTSASTPDHPVVAQPDQRLVDHRELAPGQRLRHPGRQREPADVAVVAFGVEQRQPVAAVLLGPVQRGVGGLHQLGRPGADVRPLHHAGAGRDHDAVAAEPDRPAHRGQRRLRAAAQLGAERVLVAGVLDEHHELVAAHPGHQVPADLGREPVGDGLQQLVADVVAEGVVDRLEPVQVEVAHAHLAVRLGQRGVQALEEQGAVGQPGERVVLGLVAQPVLQPMPLGGVLDHADREPRGAVGVAHQREHDVGPDRAAVLAVDALGQPRAVPRAGQHVLDLHPQGRGRRRDARRRTPSAGRARRRGSRAARTAPG